MEFKNTADQQYWIKKGPKDCQHIESTFENSARQYPDESFQRQCTTNFSVCTHPLNGEKSDRQWLRYSPSTRKLFCFAGKLFGGIEVQAAKFVTDGFKYWKSGESRIKMRENNNGHRQAMLIFANRQKEPGRIVNLAAIQIKEERRYWRHILKRLVDVLKFLAMRGFALRAQTRL